MSTNIERWKNDFKIKKSYTERIKLIAKYIKENTTVLDVGCGQKELKDFLPAKCKYTGIDIIKTFNADREVIKCDLNEKQPKFNNVFDYITCSGIVEYIEDVEKFIKYLSTIGKNVIISYACKENYNINLQEKYLWKNRFTRSEFIKLLEKYGFKVNHEEVVYGKQKIFICSK